MQAERHTWAHKHTLILRRGKEKKPEWTRARGRLAVLRWPHICCSYTAALNRNAFISVTDWEPVRPAADTFSSDSHTASTNCSSGRRNVYLRGTFKQQVVHRDRKALKGNATNFIKVRLLVFCKKVAWNLFVSSEEAAPDLMNWSSYITQLHSG